MKRCGSFSFTGTGAQVVSLPFNPTSARFRVVLKSSTDDQTVARGCDGSWVNGSNQVVNSWFTDGTHLASQYNQAKCASMPVYDSGTSTVIEDFGMVCNGNPVAPTKGLTFTVSGNYSNYRVLYEADDL